MRRWRSGSFESLVALAALVAGNALLGAIGLALLIKPFMGQLLPTPIEAHEAPSAMLAGPVVLGVLGIFLGFIPTLAGELAVAPATSAILGVPVETHLKFGVDLLGPAFWLSVVTWVLAIGLFLRLDLARSLLRRAATAIGWSFDIGFDWLYFGLVGIAGAVTRLLHHGRLELYLFLVFALLVVATIGPLWLLDGLPRGPQVLDLRFYEWGLVGLAVLGVVTVLYARSRLFAILALGVQGLAVALLYLVFGAPDLSFTQFMVEILSVVILALVMTRLDLDTADRRPLEDWARDGGVALLGGLAVTMLLWAVIEGPFDLRLSNFFNAHSGPIAHGHNVVNVILVDFRGLDTLGEISVVMTAGIAILALIRGARRNKPVGVAPVEPKPQPKRRAARKAAA
jgi:multicomponent Na+:H+ antiporter subunit A